MHKKIGFSKITLIFAKLHQLKRLVAHDKDRYTHMCV